MNDDIDARYCICADPEACTEPIVGRICRRGAAGWQQTSMINSALLKECRWTIDDYGGDSIYETQCGQSFEFNDEGVAGFKFCGYCGGRLVEVRTSCPTCGRGLRGSFPTCIDCQLVEALKNG